MAKKLKKTQKTKNQPVKARAKKRPVQAMSKNEALGKAPQAKRGRKPKSRGSDTPMDMGGLEKDVDMSTAYIANPAAKVSPAAAETEKGNGDSGAKLLALGTQKGYLTYDDLNTILPENINTAEQIDDVLADLVGHNIELVDSEEEGKELLEQQAEELGETAPPPQSKEGKKSGRAEKKAP